MRLKEFIIFIIIFTIIYFLAFYIYDQIKNKKAVQKKNEESIEAVNLAEYIKFALFYGLNSMIDENLFKMMFNFLHDNVVINLQDTANAYQISIDEIVILILFLEYKDAITKRCILKEKNCTTRLTDNEDGLCVKYSIWFYNKNDYNTILQKAGFAGQNEISELQSKNLIPGIIIKDNQIYYYGDSHE